MRPEAFSSLVAETYRNHGHHVLRRAMKLLRSEADAREVVQEVFLALLDDPSQFAERSALTTWMYSATTHRCLNRLRDTRTRSRIDADRAELLPVSTSRTNAEDTTELVRLLRRLPPDLAHVAVYYYGDEMTQDEIASVLGCSRRHVCNLLDRLRESVRLEKEGV